MSDGDFIKACRKDEIPPDGRPVVIAVQPLDAPRSEALLGRWLGHKGLAAGLLALPMGLMLSYVLIFVINQRSFGWTLQMQVAADPFLQAFAIAVLAALLAGLYPASRIVRRNTAEAIRFD